MIIISQSIKHYYALPVLWACNTISSRSVAIAIAWLQQLVSSVFLCEIYIKQHEIIQQIE